MKSNQIMNLLNSVVVKLWLTIIFIVTTVLILLSAALITFIQYYYSRQKVRDSMERLTYVAENGEVLFHPADLPDDEGITITQLAKDGRYKALEEIAERLANREQAEEQGLLLRLPCKVGDTLYRVNKGAKEPVIMMHVIQLYIKQIHKDRTIMRIDVINDADMGESCYLPCDIGERIFLTREEAEAKLKEMEGESDVL